MAESIRSSKEESSSDDSTDGDHLNVSALELPLERLALEAHPSHGAVGASLVVDGAVALLRVVSVPVILSHHVVTVHFGRVVEEVGGDGEQER